MKESIKPNGVFKLISIQDNKETILHEDNNLIVNGGFEIMVGLLQGDITKVIDKVKLGNGGIIDSILQVPQTTDAGLYGYLLETELDDVIVDIDNKAITFRFQLEQEEGNGIGIEIYNEAGLCSVDGTMFARKTFFEAIKTPEKVFIIEWKLEW